MKNEKPNRSEFLRASATGAAAFSIMKTVQAENISKPETNDELIEMTISEL